MDEALCIWTGATDTDWATTGNWDNCGGSVPASGDRVAIPDVTNDPVLASDATVAGLGPAEGVTLAGSLTGGVLTINNSVTLTTTEINADITVKSVNTSCDDPGGGSPCGEVKSTSSLEISNGAKLTLQNKVALNIASTSGSLYIGDSAGGYAGSLYAEDGETGDSRHIIHSSSSWFKSVKVNGTATDQAEIKFNGVRIIDTNPPSQSTHHVLVLDNYYNVKQFDNVAMTPTFTYDDKLMTASYIYLTSCTGSQFEDTSWDNIFFTMGLTVNGSNIRTYSATCDGVTGPTITGDSSVTGYPHGGWAYGEDYDKDDYNLFTWTDTATYTCVWAGSGSSSWTTSGNWTSCNNRQGWPDQNDWIRVPSGTDNLDVSNSSGSEQFAVKGFASGVGDGTIEVGRPGRLRLLSETTTFQSDVTITSSSGLCNSNTSESNHCFVDIPDGQAKIINNATLTLTGAIMIIAGSQNTDRFYVGDGTAAGNLTASGGSSYVYFGTSSASNSFPSFYVYGTSGTDSTVSLSKVEFINQNYAHDDAMLHFVQYYDLTTMNDVTIDPSTSNSLSGSTDAYVYLGPDGDAAASWTGGFTFKNTCCYHNPGCPASAGLKYSRVIDASAYTETAITIDTTTTSSNTYDCVLEDDPNTKLTWTTITGGKQLCDYNL